MHKQITTVITAVATVCLLSSCAAAGLLGQGGQRHDTSPVEDAPTPSTSNAGSEPTQTEVPAFHFASGDLVLGDFDYEDVKDNLFNPCEEISAEEFGSMGFTTVGTGMPLPDVGGVGCGLVREGFKTSHAISTVGSTRESFENSNRVIGDIVEIPGAFFYRGREEIGVGCVAAVDTIRGQLSVSVGEMFAPVAFDELCSEAQTILVTLFN
ncbi:DUF3558 family protein [Corynebacterium tuscaniense]|uniref:DUF3558 family protein n=1 Tax=Corynebacterium tuscaniense TaxID=302449 RepID=UPI00123ADBC0|nr:DUF3558 family protein [Corynebacterium tuscaniense]KAA8743883.1 DUF3558 domain-containing protein [Corynebacterium tuscaniense]